MSIKELHLHLISDATGETVETVVRSCRAQFPEEKIREHISILVRKRIQVDRIMKNIDQYPGPVLITVADRNLHDYIDQNCQQRNINCINILQPVVEELTKEFGYSGVGTPGGQHTLNSGYFKRIRAMEYTLSHDDGQETVSWEEADIILVGVSRTSKTPTCLYLANRGLKAANIPFILEISLPERLFILSQPLIIGLTIGYERLQAIRRMRLRQISNQQGETNYSDTEMIQKEILKARRLFTDHNWPVIDVTQRSIEETAAAILQYYNQYLETRGQRNRAE